MKIKYISEDDLNAIKSNLAGVYNEVVKPGGKTLSEFFKRDNIVKDSPFEVSKFFLDMSHSKGKESRTDVENVQRVYNHMRFLTDVQASDERIWAAYTLSEYIDYMRYRWAATSVNDVNNRYIFGYSGQRSLFRNGIARLWWIGRVTYDADRDDPYELTKYLCKDQDYIESICGRNIFNNPNIGLGTLEALYDAEKEEMNVTSELVREIGKYVNLLAGTYLLDSLEREEIYSKVKSRISYLLGR